MSGSYLTSLRSFRRSTVSLPSTASTRPRTAGGRYHEALLNDLDSSGDTFTVDTRYFSTYALLYRQSEAGGGGAPGGAPGGIAGETEKSGPASPWDTGVAD